MANHDCSNESCPLFSERVCGPIVPHINEDHRILFLFDFPSLEDQEVGTVMSGLSKRRAFLHKLLKSFPLQPEQIAFASVLRCVTKSKDRIRRSDYERCSAFLQDDLEGSSIRGIFAFGSIAARAVLETQEDAVDKLRAGGPYDTGERICSVTYALSVLMDQGCSGCSKSVFPFLARKDAEKFVKELKTRRML